MTDQFYTAEELRKRAADMARDIDLLASGWRPDERVLGESPIIEEWTVVQRGPDPEVVAMIGLATGHPRYPGERRHVLTSPIVAFDLEGRWARTAGRFYRLGEPRDFAFEELTGSGPKP